MPSANVIWPVPLQRLTPWYPGQVGVPGTDSDRGLRLDSNGKILWVDPNHVDSNDNRDGTNPDSPLRTVAAALTKCRAYAGDTIAVMFNSFWTYGNPLSGRITPIAEQVVITTPGIRLVGVAPSGSLGVPWVAASANWNLITVHAMDVLIEGFNFWQAGGVPGTVGIIAEWAGGATGLFGENLTIRHCHFYGLGYGILLDWSYNCFIEHNYFNGQVSGAIHNPSVYGDPEFCVFRDNVFMDNAGGISMPDAAYLDIANNVFQNNVAAISAQGLDHSAIHGNVIMEDPTGALNYIDTTGNAGANIVADNYLGCTLAQYPVTCADGATDVWVRNHCSDGETVGNP